MAYWARCGNHGALHGAGSVANMSNAAIGAGTLAFPYAFRSTGIFLGVALAAFFGVVLWYVIRIGGVGSGDGTAGRDGTVLCVLQPRVTRVRRAGIRGTLQVLTIAAETSGTRSYQDAVRSLLGRGAERVIEISMYLYLFGSCVGAPRACPQHPFRFQACALRPTRAHISVCMYVCRCRGVMRQRT